MRSIVVATDFSPRSDRALRRATMIAKRFGMPLSLVHVIDDDQPQYLIDSQASAAGSLLDESAGTFAQVDGIDARTHLVTGDVYAGILKVADEVDPDLIVMGPHRGQLTDAFIGTTAERTIAHSRHPILLAAGVPAALHGRALLALDMEEPSRIAAHRAKELPMLQQAELIAMHAFDAPAQGKMKLAMSAVEEVDHYVACEERRADRQFRTMLGMLGFKSAARILRVINGRAARTILEAARDAEADLIVVGTSQSNGFKRVLLGSVAEEVLADADRDILVIPYRCSRLQTSPAAATTAMSAR